MASAKCVTCDGQLVVIGDGIVYLKHERGEDPQHVDANQPCPHNPEYHLPPPHAPLCVNNPNRPKEPAITSRHIWKYPLSFGMPTRIPVSPDAKIVFVSHQEQSIYIWLEIPYEIGGAIHPGNDIAGVQRALRIFRIVATGEEIESPWKHVGTTISPGGAYVWHVYELL